MDRAERLPLDFKAIRQRLANREDSEHVQALIRIAFGFAISVYLYSTIGPQLDIHIVCIGFELLSVAILWAIAIHPQRSALRRGFGAVLDLGTTTYLMWTNGEVGAPLYGIYLWVTFGNGFRYGVGALRASHAMSLIGFGLVVTFNPFWHQHALMAGGFLILLAAVPFYGAVLLKGVTQAQDKAEQANEAKSRFLSVMSHEIRTPLNGIVGINALLRRTQVTPEQLDLINTLGVSTEILLSLLDNVLDITKIEAGKMTIDKAPFDFYQIIRNAQTFAGAQATAKGLHVSTCLDAAIPRQLIGDSHRLRQVLINLLANAVKFTHSGGVHLSVNLLHKGDETVTLRFEVVDTGVGMTNDALSRIFEPFVQADQSTIREYGGTGLGTSIAKQLVELMGGRLGATSSPGKGSTFWFELTLPTTAGDQHEDSLVGIQVIVVGTDAFSQNQIAQQLRQCGAEAITSPPEALGHVIGPLMETPRNAQVVLVDLRPHNGTVGTHSPFQALQWNRPLVVISPPSPDGDHLSRVNLPYSSTLPAAFTRSELQRAISFAISKSYRSLSGMPAAPASGEGNSHRILVAEDNATNRKIIAQILEYRGHEVTLASTGIQAIRELETGEFDVIILDKHMPGMSGMEVAKQYLIMCENKAAPMIMLTAEATAEAMQECKEAGMQAFLTKPIDPELLYETIDALTAASTGTNVNGASPAPNVVPEHTRLIDASVLAELGKHSRTPGFVQEVVSSFEDDIRDLLARLESSLRTGDATVIAEIRHTMEGTARGAGATSMARLATKLRTINDASTSEQGLRLAELRDCMAATTRAMYDYLQHAPPQSGNRATDQQRSKKRERRSAPLN